MDKKLIQKLKEKERLLDIKLKECQERDILFNELEKLSKAGTWEFDFLTKKFYCSDEFYSILDVDIESENFDLNYLIKHIIRDKDKKNFKKDLFKSIKKLKPLNHKYKIKKRDGKIKVIHILGKITYELNSKATKISGIIQDITKQMEIEDELKEQGNILIQQSKLATMGELIHMIAHQWRQPLNSISITSINLQLEQELGSLDSTELMNSLEFINAQTQKMSRTVDDFMNFLKPNKSIEKFNISELIGRTFSMIKSELTIKEINFNFDKNNIEINGYKNELEQVLVNIILNSKDAFEENNIKNREINIYIKENYKYVDIIINDNAGGVPFEIREKIFNQYFTTKSKKDGTGIGLYMSKNIIEKSFNGSIELKVENNTSNFIIKLKK